MTNFSYRPYIKPWAAFFHGKFYAFLYMTLFAELSPDTLGRLNVFLFFQKGRKP